MGPVEDNACRPHFTRAWCSALASIPIAPAGTAMASGFLVAGPLHGVVAQSESGLV